MKFIAFLTEFRKGGGQIGFVLRFRNTKGKQNLNGIVLYSVCPVYLPV